MFKIEKYENCYRIYLPIEFFGDEIKDFFFGDILEIEQIKLVQILIDKFDGFMHEGKILFENKENAERALDWIESVYVLNKLK